MSGLIMGHIWLQKIDATSKLILLALADCANDTGKCWPGLENLSEKCSLTKRTIRSKVAHLCELGFLHRQEKFDKNGRQTSNRYALNLDLIGIKYAQGEGEIVSPREELKSSSRRKQDPPHIDKSILNHKQEPVTPCRSPKATQLPTDFILTQEHQDLANELQVNVTLEFDKFKDGAMAHGRKYVNWNSAFKNWLRTARQFGHTKQNERKDKRTGSQILWDSLRDDMEQEKRQQQPQQERIR